MSAKARAKAKAAALPLNDDQSRALDEVMAAMKPGGEHLVTGYAGAGKTHLLQSVAHAAIAEKKSVVFTAPTHKAVGVLRAKMAKAGLKQVRCCTIQSLLQLRPVVKYDRQTFERIRNAKPVIADLVGIDECSMESEELIRHVRRHLPGNFALHVGDPAQLPPVGEVASASFSIKSRSHLETIVRQGEGHPVLEAARILRMSQGHDLDWSWCREVRAGAFGVYLPKRPQDWMKKAFTSPEFEADKDTFRYLCWTNRRVAEVNAAVQVWRYGGKVATPFSVGERVLSRAPVSGGESPLLNNAEEADVLEIEAGQHTYRFDETFGVEAWTACIPSWRIRLQRDEGDEVEVHMPRDAGLYNAALERIKDEGSQSRDRWRDLHAYKGSLAQLQACYAMTVHSSQGSTLRSVFLDVPDIRARSRDNVLETQQLYYVGATRPTHGLMLIGAPA